MKDNTPPETELLTLSHGRFMKSALMMNPAQKKVTSRTAQVTEEFLQPSLWTNPFLPERVKGQQGIDDTRKM